MTDRKRPFRTPKTGRLWGKLKPLARQMRHAPTSAEDALWQRLRNRQVAGLHFRRQHSIDRFIVDFYCAEVRLVIEVDGPSHAGPTCDAERQEYLEALGLRVLRVTDAEVLAEIDAVMARIAQAAP
ncbi:MAG TPA: endonuclease domain-containing protein [Aggregatilineaceae bacterium]|nr:endonuclease domain-containing protein [Aggregatilineaceae bacterium]